MRRKSQPPCACRAASPHQGPEEVGSRARRLRPPFEPGRKSFDGRGDQPQWAEGMPRQNQHARLGELHRARRRQRQAVADAVHEFVGSGDCLEQCKEIVGSASHRADHREVVRVRQGRQEGRRLAAPRDEIESGFMSEDSAEWAACEASRRCRTRATTARSRRRAQPRSRPTSLRGCAEDHKGCW